MLEITHASVDAEVQAPDHQNSPTAEIVSSPHLQSQADVRDATHRRTIDNPRCGNEESSTLSLL